MVMGGVRARVGLGMALRLGVGLGIGLRLGFGLGTVCGNIGPGKHRVASVSRTGTVRHPFSQKGHQIDCITCEIILWVQYESMEIAV